MTTVFLVILQNTWQTFSWNIRINFTKYQQPSGRRIRGEILGQYFVPLEWKIIYDKDKNYDDTAWYQMLLHSQPLLKSIILSHEPKLNLYKSTIQPVTLYVCQGRSKNSKSRKQHLIFMRKLFRNIVGSIQDPNTGEWRIQYKMEPEQLNCKPIVVGVIKSKRHQW